MSENRKNNVCPECGAELPEQETKQSKFGIRSILNFLLEQEDAPSEKQEKSEEITDDLQNVRVGDPKKTWWDYVKHGLSYKLINRIVVLVLALAMLALVFAPFAFAKVTLADGSQYKIKLSASDCALVSIVSFGAVSEREMLESDYFNRRFPDPTKKDQTETESESVLSMQDAGIVFVDQSSGVVIQEQIVADGIELETILIEAVTEEETVAMVELTEKEKISEYKKALLLYAMDRDMGMSGSFIGAMLMILVYVILCLTLVIFSAKELIVEILAQRKNRTTPIQYRSDGILCMLLCLLPALCFFFTQMCRYALKNALLDTVFTLEIGLAWGMVMTLILAALGTVFVCLVSLLARLHLNRRYFGGIRIRNAVSALLVIFVMITVALPCVQVNVWNPTTNEVGSAQLSLSELGEITGRERQYYRSMSLEGEGGMLESYWNASKDTAETAGDELLHTFFMTSRISSIRDMYGVLMAFAGITLLLCGFWLWSLLRRIFFCGTKRRMMNTFKFFTFVSATVILVTSILLTYLAELCLSGDLFYILEFKLGWGVVAMFICMLAAIILRSTMKKQKRYIDVAYDNADVSYAPYVFEKGQ